MENLNITIVSRSFYPLLTPRSFRTTELVKEFCRQGFKVTLVTHYLPEQHDALQAEFGFNIIPLGPVLPKGPKYQNFIFRAVYRLANVLLDYPNILLMPRVKRVLLQAPVPDILITIAAPHTVHWGAVWAKSSSKEWAKTWIADCGDAFMGNDLDRFPKPFYFKYFEKWFCREADWITIPNIAMKQNFYAEFHGKFQEITQGFKFEDSEKHLKPYTPHPIPTFAFSGTFIEGNGGRDPRPFIRFLLDTGRDFRFYIFTPRADLISDLVKKSDGKIIVKKYIPREDLLGFLSTMDFVVNIAYDPATQSPSKLIDYSLVKRPILNIANDQLGEFETEATIAFINANYQHKFEFSNFDKFRIEHVAGQFLKLHEQRRSFQ